MPSLLDLPDFVLEDIIYYAIGGLDLPSTPTGIFRLQGSKRVTKRKEALSTLLLTSQRIKALTDRVVYLRMAFWLDSSDALKYFFIALGDENVQRVRNIGVNIYNETETGYLSRGAEDVIKTGISLLERLPSRLRSLSLEPPARPVPDVEVRDHSKQFAAALSRLSELRKLKLSFGSEFLHLDTFCNAAPSFVDCGIDPNITVPSSPMFPALRYLFLSGRIADTVKPVHFAKALSEEQLPSIEVLVIHNLSFKVVGMSTEEWAFSPEAILGMHPLHIFAWHNHDYVNDEKNPLVNIPPPTRSHLQALCERHGGTLESVEVYHTQRKLLPEGVESDITEDFTEKLRAGIPGMKDITSSVEILLDS